MKKNFFRVIFLSLSSATYTLSCLLRLKIKHALRLFVVVYAFFLQNYFASAKYSMCSMLTE